MTENNKSSKKDDETRDFKDELSSLKEEMAQLKDMLRSKAKEEAANQSETHEDRHSHGPKGFRIEFDDEDFGFEGVDETLGNYLSSVMEGVAQNISQSMKQMTSGFQFENIAKEVEREVKHAKRDLEHSKRDIEREVRRAEREARRAAREAKRSFGRSKVRFHKLSEEELDKFYKQAPDLTTALSDEKKLRLLKGLEEGPMYQKDLSEQTEIKGGTFKHHMDTLLEVQYVAQEAVRGRYFITQLGVEALKLSEMLFRRYIFITEEEATEREDDEEIEVEIDEDISQDAEAVEQMEDQNEEEND